MTEKELIEKLCHGTTTKPEKLKVLFLGENLALVHFGGGSYSSGRTIAYAPSHINLFRFTDFFRQNPMGRCVHEGRCKKGHIAKLIENAKIEDAAEPARIASVFAKEREDEIEKGILLETCERQMESMKQFIQSACSGKVLNEFGPSRVWNNGKPSVYGTMCVQLGNKSIVNLTIFPNGSSVESAAFPPENFPRTTEILKGLLAIPENK